MPSSANPIEIAWTVVSLIGAIVAASLCRDVVLDALAIHRASSNGVRKRATYLCIAITGVFVMTLLIFVVIGVFAMLTPQPESHDNATPTQIAITAGFITVAVLMVGISLYWRVVRIYARRRGYTAVDTAVVAGEST